MNRHPTAQEKLWGGKIGLDRFARIQLEHSEWLVARVGLVGYGAICLIMGCILTAV